MTTLKDLMNLPDAIQNELESRADLRAQALAHKIVNRVTGSNMTPNPYVHNPYHGSSSDSGSGSVRLTQNMDEVLGKK